MDIKERTALILQRYKEGKKYRNIAKEVGISIAGVGKTIVRAKKAGLLPDERRKESEPRERKAERKIPDYKKRIRELADVWNEEPVDCDINVSKQCVWGCCPTANETVNLCNYCVLVGHSRGCKFTECHRFIKITKKTPRPLVRFDSKIGVNYGIDNNNR